MANVSSPVLHHSQSNGIDSTPIVVILATILSVAVYSVYKYNSGIAYANFPFVGRDENTKTTQQLKLRWVRQAKSLIFDTLAKVRLAAQIPIRHSELRHPRVRNLFNLWLVPDL